MEKFHKYSFLSSLFKIDANKSGLEIILVPEMVVAISKKKFSTFFDYRI
jgi:hypothetical protein